MKFPAVLWVLLFHEVLGQEIPSEHPDVGLSTEDLVRKYGYPIETHEVTTEDGYLVTLHRIPHGKKGFEVNKKPVLILHGLFGRSENFIDAGWLNASLAYYAAERGYDVWLGNTRGNGNSKYHQTLNPSKSKFWKFSWHEIGLYDISAMIDYILKTTGKNKLSYIGHSQGGTVFYVLMCERPDYQQKIVQASMLAPGGFMYHFKNEILIPLAKNHRMLTKMAEQGKIYQLPPPMISLKDLLTNFCSSTFKQICNSIYKTLMGNSKESDLSVLPLIFSHAGISSTYQALHYAQNIDSAHFRKWDYGEKKNLEMYGSPEPPDYPVETIRVPTAFYYSMGDNMAFYQDVEEMCARVANCTRKLMMENHKWTHLDFIMSANLTKKVSEPLFDHMDKFWDNSNEI